MFVVIAAFFAIVLFVSLFDLAITEAPAITIAVIAFIAGYILIAVATSKRK